MSLNTDSTVDEENVALIDALDAALRRVDRAHERFIAYGASHADSGDIASARAEEAEAMTDLLSTVRNTIALHSR